MFTPNSVAARMGVCVCGGGGKNGPCTLALIDKEYHFFF